MVLNKYRNKSSLIALLFKYFCTSLTSSSLLVFGEVVFGKSS